MHFNGKQLEKFPPSVFLFAYNEKSHLMFNSVKKLTREEQEHIKKTENEWRINNIKDLNKKLVH